MALGLPVVTTNVGSMAEIVQHGVTGYVVPPYDEEGVASLTDTLLRDPALRRRLGQAGLQFATAHFGVDKCVEQHLLAYRMALGSQ